MNETITYELCRKAARDHRLPIVDNPKTTPAETWALQFWCGAVICKSPIERELVERLTKAVMKHRPPHRVLRFSLTQAAVKIGCSHREMTDAMRGLEARGYVKTEKHPKGRTLARLLGFDGFPLPELDPPQQSTA